MKAILTLRGTAELKEMLISLSKLQEVSMNEIIQELIKKEYTQSIEPVRQKGHPRDVLRAYKE